MSSGLSCSFWQSRVPWRERISLPEAQGALFSPRCFLGASRCQVTPILLPFPFFPSFLPLEQISLFGPICRC